MHCQEVRLGEALDSSIRRLRKKAATAELNGADRFVWRLVELLGLRPDDLLVGLGASLSPHCLAMLELVSLRYQIVLVDPLPARLARLASESSVRLIGMSALEFARFPIQWDKIVLDDAVAAEDDDGADELLSLLFARLRPGGRMIAVLPATAVPPSAALKRAMGFASRVRDCGFEVTFDTVQGAPHQWNLVVGSKLASA
jgi:hypothetical protein